MLALFSALPMLLSCLKAPEAAKIQSLRAV
jgi:hypothetical protein